MPHSVAPINAAVYDKARLTLVSRQCAHETHELLLRNLVAVRVGTKGISS